MSLVEQLIADLNKCLSQDPLKFNELHQMHYNASRNKCIGGKCADDATKIRFYQILYQQLTPEQYQHFCEIFDHMVRAQFAGSRKYVDYKPVMPDYGQEQLSKEQDHCVFTEDIYLALRQALL